MRTGCHKATTKTQRTVGRTPMEAARLTNLTSNTAGCRPLLGKTTKILAQGCAPSNCSSDCCGSTICNRCRLCTKRRVRVQGPIAPSASGEAILEEHPQDGHHRQAAVGDLRVQ